VKLSYMVFFAAVSIATSASFVRHCAARADQLTGPIADGNTVTENLKHVDSVSEDRKAFTTICENAVIAIGGIKESKLVEKRLFSLEMPLRTSAQKLPVELEVRGYIDIRQKSRALLIVHAAGKTTIVDLTKADESHVRKPPSQQLPNGFKREKSDTAHNYFQEIKAEVPANSKVLIVTFLLLIERDAPHESYGGLLTLDSLDGEFVGAMNK
jgi:hypothetical protein